MQNCRDETAQDKVKMQTSQLVKKIPNVTISLLIWVLILGTALISWKCSHISSMQQIQPEHINMDHIQECSVKMFCNKDETSTIRLPLKMIQHCYPDLTKTYKLPFIINVSLLFIVGGFGNLLTLFAVPYAFARHADKLSIKWNEITFLMLHLSFCDLAYIMIGLSGFLDIYINEGFDRLPGLCWLTALLRHIICYADFLTLALIAILRLKGIYKLRRNKYKKGSNDSARVAYIYCAAIWAIAFIFIVPIIFELKIGYLDWGKFGYNPMSAACNTITCSESYFHGPAVIYTFAFFIPFIILMISYMAVIPIFLRNYTNSYKDDLEEYTNVCQINKALAMLAASYTVFTAPLLFIEWIETIDMEQQTRTLLFVVGYNWYWWIYGINFLVYTFSLQEFRKIYKMFLLDVRDFISCKVIKPASEITPLNVGPRCDATTLQQIQHSKQDTKEASGIHRELARTNSAPPHLRKSTRSDKTKTSHTNLSLKSDRHSVNNTGCVNVAFEHDTAI